MTQITEGPIRKIRVCNWHGKFIDKDFTFGEINEDLFKYFSIGPGWKPLIQKLLEDLVEAGWDGMILQVKEKFGGLRFYYTYGSGDAGYEYPNAAKFDELVRAADNKALKTCEECGKKGRLWTISGWLKTLCQNCHETRLAERSAKTRIDV